MFVKTPTLVHHAMFLSLFAAGAAWADDDAGSKLAPDWEKELVQDHAVVAEKAKFVPGKGLEFKSEDGKFKLQTRLRIQMLYEAAAEGEDVSQDFMLRRARLQFGGNMWGKNNKFKAEFAFSPRDISNEGVDFDGDDVDDGNIVRTSPLLDYYHEFTHLRDLSFRVGQYKVPYSRQRVISSGNMQLVDRSKAANAEFNVDRDIGFDFRSKDLFGTGKLKYYAGVWIGEGRNTSNKTVGSGDLGLMYIARVEVLPFGSFSDYSEGDLDRSPSPGLSIGAAYAYIDHAAGEDGILGSAIPEGDVWRYNNATADAIFKVAGFSIFTEGFLRTGTSEDNNPTRNGWGWMAQGGYLLPHTAFEITGRYGLNRRLGGPAESSMGEGLNEVGGGVGHYFAHHPLKLQADVFSYSELEADGSELVGRLQFQAAL